VVFLWRVRLLLWASVVVGALLTPDAVSAASPTLNITIGSEPVESIATQLGVSGTAAFAPGGNVYYLSVKPAGGAACGANPQADTGSSEVLNGSTPGGAYEKSVNWTFQTAGSYLACAWLLEVNSKSESSVALTAQTTITVRRPHLSLSIAAPRTVAPGQTFQVSTTAQTETGRAITEFILPSTGGGCPANAGAAGSASGGLQVNFVNGSTWFVTGGPFTEAPNEMLTGIGGYLVCAYAEYQSQGSPPEGTSSVAITVVKPPPLCVVPKLAPRTTLKAAEHALAAGNCTVGSLRYVASRTIPRGDVVGLRATAGVSLASATPIQIVVSAGPPCVVPRFDQHLSVSWVKHRILAANCRVGKVTSVASTKRRRGSLVRLTPRPGTRLPPQAVVQIMISAGRPGHRR
jgi:hypothetical protein